MKAPAIALLLLPMLTAASLVATGRTAPTDLAPIAPGQNDSTPTIVALTPMRVARMAHTATPLLDGSVLVLGGFTEAQHAAYGAERFDPRANRFAPLAPMRTLRHSHTATILPDGRVLIVGGFAAGNQPTGAAELFDPVTATFTVTGALGAPRAGHVAVPLANGRVLIAGGVGPDWTFLRSAEVYDPATGRFSPTGDMTVARESHVGVALEDGDVLIAGGHRDRRERITIYASAERYDAVTGTFRPTGAMTTRRHKHDAVRLADGRVLVTGGSDERDDQGAYATTELFDPQLDRFTAGPRMQRTRYKHVGSSLVLPSGRVLIAGGASVAELFDPVASRFSIVGGVTTLTGQFSAVAPLAGSGALITGGYGAGRGPQPGAWRLH
jgi:hypothetical protein